MTHPDTQKMIQLVEEQTGYRVSVDLIAEPTGSPAVQMTDDG
jgi:hypothetical protein